MEQRINCLDKDILPTSRGKGLDLDDLARKWVIAELMCNMRLNKAEFYSRFGQKFDEYFDDESEHIKECESLNLLSNESENIKITSEGKLMVRYICSGFDAYLKKNKRLFSSLV